LNVSTLQKHRVRRNSSGGYPAPAPYRPWSIKRSRRTKADIDGIKQAIVEVIREDPPMTVRQVFYQLVTRGVIEKTETEYHVTVIRLMTDMRLSGELRWDWVVDESRRRRITRTYDNITDAVEDCAETYRRSALRECPHYLEIWCEKDALAGALWDVTSDYDVPLLVSRGMPSLTLLYNTAVEILRATRAGKLSYIYQFGDHDPSGVRILQAIERRLNEMCRRFDCWPPIVHRVALSEEHIAEFNLPTRPTKREGNAHANGFDGDSVELDALPPGVLRDMVRETIEQHIAPEVVDVLRAAEESERELLRTWRPGGVS
jgi:hypothetical protein